MQRRRTRPVYVQISSLRAARKISRATCMRGCRMQILSDVQNSTRTVRPRRLEFVDTIIYLHPSINIMCIPRASSCHHLVHLPVRLEARGPAVSGDFGVRQYLFRWRKASGERRRMLRSPVRPLLASDHRPSSRALPSLQRVASRPRSRATTRSRRSRHWVRSVNAPIPAYERTPPRPDRQVRSKELGRKRHGVRV